MDVTLPALRRKHWTSQNSLDTKCNRGGNGIGAICSQTAPALAYGPGNALAGHNDVRAMGYFRIPLGAPQAEKDRAPSFGLTVKREFQFNDPLYETMSGSYRNSQRLTVKAMDLRFGMNGKFSGFDVGGFNAFQAKTLLNAAADEDEGVPNWVWLAIGVPVVIAGIVLMTVAVSCDDDPYLLLR